VNVAEVFHDTTGDLLQGKIEGKVREGGVILI